VCVIEREREREGGKEAECYFRHVHVLMYPLSISIHTRYIQKRAHTFRENMHILHTHAPIAGTLSRHSKPDTYQYIQDIYASYTQNRCCMHTYSHDTCTHVRCPQSEQHLSFLFPQSHTLYVLNSYARYIQKRCCIQNN